MNAGKIKVMVCAKTKGGEHLNLNLNGEMLEEFDSFMYLGSIIGKNGAVVENVIGRLNERQSVRCDEKVMEG